MIKNFFLTLALCFALPIAAQADDIASHIKECIAPSDPGGGWDFTCRSVSNLLYEEKIVPNTIRTVNMAGAGGGVAFAHVASKRKNDNSVFVAASTATTTVLAQNKFRGLNENMVRWVGALGADYGVIAVSKDSPYKNINQLMNALKENTGSVKFAGASAAGGWDNLKVLLAAQKAGVDDVKTIRYLSFNNGGDALVQVIGGHVDAFTGDISETKGFLESGDLKILAVFSDSRIPAPFDQIPTAKEQGIDFVGPNWRGFYLPGDVSQETYDWWVKNLTKLADSPEWQKVMEANGLAPFKKVGTDFNDYVMSQIADIKNISQEIGIIR